MILSSNAKLKRITGSAYLSYRTNVYFTSELAISLSIGMGAICLIMIVLFRSLKLGLIAMVPNVLPVLMNYAILGRTGPTGHVADRQRPSESNSLRD